MEEKELTHEESLKVIHGMLDMAKNKITDTGFHFLLWGVLVTTACLTQYFMIQNGMGKQSNWVWVFMPVIGIPLAFIYEYRKSRTQRTHTHFDRLYGYLWLSFGITLAIIIFICVSYQVIPIAFILVLVGLATFVSGCIFPFTPLIVGACIVWVTAAICPQFNPLDQLLLNAAAIFAGYIIPGILLWNKSKRNTHV